MADQEFITVARVNELSENGQKSLMIQGQPVLLCRLDGEYFAIENRCSHELTPLQGGSMAQCIIICPLHGAEFDMRTGESLGPPAFDPIYTYAVRVVGDAIEVSQKPKAL